MLLVVIGLSAAFAVVNGVHDAGNAIAAPIVTGAMRPAPAVVLAAVFHVVGALVVGTAVAATIAGIVVVPAEQMLEVLAAAVLGALVWNLVTLWWGLPCSSGHCLVGALAGAALAKGGASAVHWGGLHGLRPEGVLGSLLWLVISTTIAFPLAMVGIRLARRSLRRASRRVEQPVRRGEVITSAGLAFAHGSNDHAEDHGSDDRGPGCRRPALALRGAFLGGHGIRSPLEPGHVVRGMAGRADARSAHLPHPVP